MFPFDKLHGLGRNLAVLLIFIIPLSLLFGGAFLVLTDLLARTVATPSEIPIGVLTALIGGPFFCYIFRKQQKAKKI